MAALSRTPSPALSGSESDSVVATPMTPRTKLRELFATIDGPNTGNNNSSGSDRERESNEENKTPSRKAKKVSSGAKLSARKSKSPRLADTSTFVRAQVDSTAASSKPKSPLQSRTGSRSPRATSPLIGAGALAASTDEDSDVEVRPRGRFAARMQAAASASTLNDTTSTAEPLADNARERVRRMLQQAADAEKQPEDGESAVKTQEDTTNDAEDEEDAPVAAARPRKRLINLRTARRSPSASPRQSGSPAGTPSRSTREDSPPMFMTPSKQAEREDSPNMFMTPEKGGDDATTVAPGRNARFQALVARKREEARAREEAEERKREARMAAMADNSDNDDDDVAMGGLDEDDDLLMRDAEGADDNPSDITDDEGGRRLTQKMAGARPERKASKKALEEMHRETQRMARNLQLAHEAKTRKKITKASLFERFNFHPAGAAAAAAPAPAAKEPTSSSRPTSPASPQNNTDTEMRAVADTPPSSPPVPVLPDAPFDRAKEAAIATTTEAADDELALPRLDKGKGKAVETFAADEPPKTEVKRNIRIRMPMVQQANLVMIDSDDDGELEIVQTAKNKLDILFDNVPLKRNQEPRSMYALRRLAQIGSPGKKPRARPAAKSGKIGIGAGPTDLTLNELQQSLQERARRQAKLEREERLDMLRAKGVKIQTEEEREREMEEVDDIVARARQEAEELMQRERDEAKKEKKDGGADAVPDVLDWDESEDEGDYEPEEEDEGDEEDEEREIELSGSEDEEEEKDGDEEVLAGTLIDGEAESTDNDSEDGKDEDVDEEKAGEADDVLPTPTRPRPSKRRTARIISDDEDEAEDHNDDHNNNNTPAAAKPVLLAFEAKTPGPKPAFTKSPSGLANNNDSPQVPTSVLRSATKSFIPGLPVAVGGPAGLGLTQIFAGTMSDDSQMAGSPGGFGSPSQMMPTIGNFADGDYSQLGPSGEKMTNAAAILDSQRVSGGNDGGDSNATATGPSQMVQFNFSQSQAHGLDSLLREPDVSQLSQFGPSQDNGMEDNYTPLKVRFIEHQPSTIETVVLGGGATQTQTQTQPPTQSQAPSQSQTESPVAPRRPRGRLFRKADVANIVEEDEEEEEDDKADDAEDESEEDDEAEPTDGQAMEAATAFAKMRQAALQKQFDRKKSKAKEMVEEQAEESEDEYAGLGGADGEDSDSESLASVKDIIDDDQRVSSTENAKLAAFYADRERENDEKQVEKLFRDVTTGMLRRKRGAGGAGDYDLSDSDDGGEARRRMKRRQFARMQKALFADERVFKVAENPRNQAFLRTIEDRGSDDEMDFIFDGAAAQVPATTATTSTTDAPAPIDTTTSIPDSQPSATTGTTGAANTEPQQQHQHPRRRRLSANPGKKPANIGEIRESLSSLLEDYHNDGSNLSIVADSEFGSDNEGGNDDADGNKENQPEAAAAAAAAVAPVPSVMRRPGRGSNVQVVDRISLKRNNSNMSTASASSAASASSSSSSTASTVIGGMGPTGFRVPALLRRATTNSLVSNGSSSSGSNNSGSGILGGNNKDAKDKSSTLDSGKIKKNASKMSGIHYFARENERRAAIAESDKRRQAKKAKNAEGRARAVGGLFGGGKFE